MAAFIITQYAFRSILLSFLIWGSRKNMGLEGYFRWERNCNEIECIWCNPLYWHEQSVAFWAQKNIWNSCPACIFHASFSQIWLKSPFSNLPSISNTAVCVICRGFFSHFNDSETSICILGTDTISSLWFSLKKDSLNYLKWKILIPLIQIQWDIKV